MPKEKLTKSKERISKYGEVYTPSRIVKQMCDMLEKESPGSFTHSKTFLEPSCGTGNFLVEILMRKLDNCKNESDCLTALMSIYGIDILQDNVDESKRRMLEIFCSECGFLNADGAKNILEHNIICGNSLEIMKKLETAEWDDVI